MTGSELGTDDIVRLMTKGLKNFIESYATDGTPQSAISWEKATVENHTNPPSGSDPKHIHPEFIAKLVGLVKAFSLLEKPNKDHYDLLNNSSSTLATVLNDILNRTADSSIGTYSRFNKNDDAFKGYNEVTSNVTIQQQGNEVIFKVIAEALVHDSSLDETIMAAHVQAQATTNGLVQNWAKTIVEKIKASLGDSEQSRINDMSIVNGLATALRRTSDKFCATNKDIPNENVDLVPIFNRYQTTISNIAPDQNITHLSGTIRLFNSDNLVNRLEGIENIYVEGNTDDDNELRNKFYNAMRVNDGEPGYDRQLNITISTLLNRQKQLSQVLDKETFFASIFVTKYIDFKVMSNREPNRADLLSILNNMRGKTSKLYNALNALKDFASNSNTIAHFVQMFRDAIYISQPNTAPAQPKGNQDLSRQIMAAMGNDSSDLEFFSNYFNVVGNDNRSLNLNQATVQVVNNGGRLNVKKANDLRNVILGAMAGGATNTQDFVIISKITYSPTITLLFAGEMIKGASSEDVKRNLRAIQYGQNTFFNKPISGLLTSNYLYANHVKNAALNKNLSDLWKLPAKHDGYTDGFYELNSQLAKSAIESMQSNNDQWLRFDDEFRKINKNQEEVAVDSRDNCEFFPGDTSKCLNFFQECLQNGDTWNDKCSFLFKDAMYDFGDNIAPKNIMDRVVKMNPAYAYTILQKFNFASFVSDNDTRIPGFRRTKIQSVNQWMRDMEESKFENFGSHGKELKDLITRNNMGSDQATRNTQEARRAGFLRYLAILVDWVNANPQVLNEEEKDPDTYIARDYPEPNKSYKIYQYVAPRAKKDHVNVRNLLNAIFNLKVSLLNGTSGFNGTRIGSDVFGMTSNIVSPFSQYAYSSALPQTNVSLITAMAGGDVTKSMSELVKPYSSEILEDIFNTLLDTMNKMSSPRRLALKDSSYDQMRDRINNLKKLELELMEQFRKAGLKYQLYKASDGYIMPRNIRDSDLDTVLKKHENLLDLSQVYNRKATTVLDMFKIILEVIVDKSDSSVGSKVKYTRPMKATY